MTKIEKAVQWFGSNPVTWRTFNPHQVADIVGCSTGRVCEAIKIFTGKGLEQLRVEETKNHIAEARKMLPAKDLAKKLSISKDLCYRLRRELGKEYIYDRGGDRHNERTKVKRRAESYCGKGTQVNAVGWKENQKRVWQVD